MNYIFSGMFTPPTLEQKRLSHVTLSLFPFDVVILYLWHSRLKDVKGIVPMHTPCFVAKTLCCSTLFVNFQRISIVTIMFDTITANIRFQIICGFASGVNTMNDFGIKLWA